MTSENSAKTTRQHVARIQAAAELRARFEQVVLSRPMTEREPMKLFLACDGSVAGSMQLKRSTRRGA